MGTDEGYLSGDQLGETSTLYMFFGAVVTQVVRITLGSVRGLNQGCSV